MKHLILSLLFATPALSISSCSYTKEKVVIYEDDSLIVYREVTDYNVSQQKTYIVEDKESKKTNSFYPASSPIFENGFMYETSHFMGKYAEKGRWVEVKKTTNEYDFRYFDTICQISKSLDGVYILSDDNTLNKFCGLDSLISLHDLPNGKYYFSNPGFFYTRKKLISSLIQ